MAAARAAGAGRPRARRRPALHSLSRCGTPAPTQHAASQALEHRGAKPSPVPEPEPRAPSPEPEPPAGPPLAGVGLDASEQLYELDPMTRAGGLCGRVVSSADFTLREPEAKPLAGSLQSEADVYLTTHANTLHLRAAPPLQRSPLPPSPLPRL